MGSSSSKREDDAAAALLQLSEAPNDGNDMSQRLNRFMAETHRVQNLPPRWEDPSLRSKCDLPELCKILSARAYYLVCNWYTLLGLVERHEARIRRRWTKMSAAKRRKMLHEVVGPLPEKHRPAREGAGLDPTDVYQTNVGIRTLFWPSWNYEDLSTPRNFLTLLNARARHPPYAFAAGDLHGLSFTCLAGLIGPDWFDDYRVLLSAVDFPERYGWCSGAWEDVGKPDDWPHYFNGLEALLILDVQFETLADLVHMVHAILDEMNIPKHERTDNELYPRQPEPPAIAPNLHPVAKTRTLLSRCLEQPYRCPEAVDFKHIERMFRAGYTGVRDHLWLLREDPGYFASHLRACFEHRHEHILTKLGAPHPRKKDHTGRSIWLEVLAHVVQAPLEELVQYDHLLGLVHQLQKLRCSIQPCEDHTLPANQAYLQALLDIRAHLDDLHEESREILSHTMLCSPLTRKISYTTCDASGCTHVKVDEKHLTPALKQLRTVLGGINPLVGGRVTHNIEDMEHLIQSNKDVRSLITPPIAAIIGTLSVVHETYQQLKLDQPWHRWAGEWIPDDGSLSEPFTVDFASLKAALEVGMKSKAMDKVVELGSLDYPIDELWCPETFDALKAAELSLDKFWSLFDQLWQPKDFAQEDFKAQSPQWYRAEQLLRGWKGQLRHESLETFQTRKADQDVKEGATSTQGSCINRPPPIHQYLGPTFAVDDRALKVFRAMYWVPQILGKPNGAEWKELLHALLVTGLKGEKMFGGLWLFTMTLPGPQEEVSFFIQEPWPDGKVKYPELRRIGRRLTRMFG